MTVPGKGGRPKTGRRKWPVLLWLLDEERAEIERAARERGESVAGMLVRLGLEEAGRPPDAAAHLWRVLLSDEDVERVETARRERETQSSLLRRLALAGLEAETAEERVHLRSLCHILAAGGPALSADEAARRAHDLVDEVRTLRVLEAELRRQRDALMAPVPDEF